MMDSDWTTRRTASHLSRGNATESKSRTLTDSRSITLERTDTVRTVAGGLIKLRGRDDNLPQRWWFASTAIPLVAATIGPLSNVLSIAALVTPWRVTLPNNGQLPEGTDAAGIGIADPHWEIILNALSLACGFTGNLFLLLNFTGRVRYIIALPLSILFWILSSVILIGTTIAMNVYIPPVGPGQIYSQGFWHAVLAAVLYFAGGIILMINMIGYFRGHYPQQFNLDDNQRTLILQTMMFFFWLAGGSGVFCAIEGFTYPDALYYADVSILTIGFGDYAPATDTGRGFLFVFELIGIIFLGLVISSVSRFAANIGVDKIIKKHQKNAQESTVGRTVTNEKELRERLGLPPRSVSTATMSRQSELGRRESLAQYGSIKIVGRTVTFHEKRQKPPAGGGGRGGAARTIRPLSRDAKLRAHETANTPLEKRRQRRQKLLLLQEEKDRFDAMRQIQEETKRWKQYWASGMALLAFGILWCFGALVFMVTEARILHLSYFDSLYFCFVALLTIGYGDFSPKSNIGKPFFIVWSLIAVPIVTVLIQQMSKTVVSAVNRGTFKVADWTIMPRKGVLKQFLDNHPNLRDYLVRLAEQREARKRLARGFQVQDPDEPIPGGRQPGDPDLEAEPGTFSTMDTTTTGFSATVLGIDEKGGASRVGLERLAAEDTEHDLARKLAMSIKTVAHDLRADPPKRYSYEEWAHFTKLIRFSRRTREEVELIEEEEGLVEWDWIGENSPMLADITEAEWVLNRLCESLNRYMKWQAYKHQYTASSDINPRDAGIVDGVPPDERPVFSDDEAEPSGARTWKKELDAKKARGDDYYDDEDTIESLDLEKQRTL